MLHQLEESRAARFSVRTLVVVAASLLATGVSVVRIRQLYKDETPPPNPFQEVMKAHPEYAQLIFSIRERNPDKVEQLITRNPWLINYSLPEIAGPPLLMAAMSNQPDMVELLLNRGADPSIKGRWGGTALHWAAWRGASDVVEVLLKHGADVNATSDNDKSTPLFWAARGSHDGFGWRNNPAAAVQDLLKAGADPDTKNSDGFYAVSVADPTIADLLVKAGATRRPPATQPTFGTATGEYGWRGGFGYGMGFGRGNWDHRHGQPSTQPQTQPQ